MKNFGDYDPDLKLQLRAQSMRRWVRAKQPHPMAEEFGADRLALEEVWVVDKQRWLG